MVIFHQTSPAAPEAYDARLEDGTYLGRVRLRSGKFTVYRGLDNLEDPAHEEVALQRELSPEGSSAQAPSVFTPEEREEYLALAASLLEGTPAYLVANAFPYEANAQDFLEDPSWAKKK